MKKKYPRRIRIHLQGNKFFFFLNFNSEQKKISTMFPVCENCLFPNELSFKLNLVLYCYNVLQSNIILSQIFLTLYCI